MGKSKILVNNNENSRFKEISLAILAGVLAEGLEDIITRFFHDFTNTEYLEHDHTTPILSSWLVTIAMELTSGENNLFASVILSTGLAIVISDLVNNILYQVEIDYAEATKKFVFDSTLLTILLTIYQGFLKELKKFQKKNPGGPLFEITKNIIRILPVIIYFAYIQFRDNLQRAREETPEIKQREQIKIKCLPFLKKDV